MNQGLRVVACMAAWCDASQTRQSPSAASMSVKATVPGRSPLDAGHTAHARSSALKPNRGPNSVGQPPVRLAACHLADCDFKDRSDGAIQVWILSLPAVVPNASGELRNGLTVQRHCSLEVDSA